MSDSPPKGKELQLAKRLIGYVQQLKKYFKLIESLNGYPPTITADHSIEGVRTNGWQGITTITDTILELESMKVSLLRGSAIIDQSLAIIDKAAHSFESEFKICTFCEGLHGMGGQSEEKLTLGREGCRFWEDCEECKGRGLVKNE